MDFLKTYSRSAQELLILSALPHAAHCRVFYVCNQHWASVAPSSFIYKKQMSHHNIPPQLTKLPVPYRLCSTILVAGSGLGSDCHRTSA